MHSKSFLCLCFALFAAGPLFAQAVDGASTASASTNDAGPTGIIPFVKGPNLSLGTTSQHDSSSGWSSLLTPDVAWRFSRRYSADVEVPVYAYVNVLVTGGTKLRPTYTPATRHFTLADTSLSGHYQISPRIFDYDFTATLGLPTGDKSIGLGAGEVTYNLNNHFERSAGIFSPDIELGIGDSSQLFDQRIRRGYTTVGELAHFQAGTSVDLPLGTSFSAEAYEELPLASQILYSTTGRGRKKVTTATNKGVAEDNGFLTTLDIPLNPHTTLSGFYNRSLRNHIDTAGFSFTFFLRTPPPAARALASTTYGILARRSRSSIVDRPC